MDEKVQIRIFKPEDRIKFNILGLEIKYYKHSKRYKFNKRMFLKCITLRCKILYIVGWLFNLRIEVPDFEWKARGCDMYGKKIN